MKQLISYIALSAPATRRYAQGDEPLLRPEIGFTPQWFHQSLGIDFGGQWHNNPACRRDAIIAMRQEIRRRFPDTSIGLVNQPDEPLDLLTGTFGANTIAAIYGIPIQYFSNQWPTAIKKYFSNEQIDQLEPPHLVENSFFNKLIEQLDWIADHEGKITGFINWQGILNNAHRLRGEKIFIDLIDDPDRCLQLFECICATMIEAAQLIQERQRKSGVDIRFFTISNCLVNMISPKHYERLILPFDRKIAESFECIGIHNCAWKADPYLNAYASITNVGYIDMGMESDLNRARDLFPETRRAIMYPPTKLLNGSKEEIEQDLLRIAQTYAPCDIVFADIEENVPDDKILFIIQACQKIST